ncbi:MAG: methytransferase partner Trm112 [Dehalococcoidia bacterium]|nr:methytransferase partner Trm112 [Dehalococcoidia bacterium]
MKKELMQILACPVCKGELSLTIEEESEKEEVVSGSLYCSKCQHAYPIANGIPNLLPPDMNQETQGQ